MRFCRKFWTAFIRRDARYQNYNIFWGGVETWMIVIRGQISRNNFRFIQHLIYMTIVCDAKQLLTVIALGHFFRRSKILSSIRILNMDQTLYISLDVSFLGRLARKKRNNLISLLIFICEILFTLNRLRISV